MIKRTDVLKSKKDAQEALAKAKALEAKRHKNKDTAGPFYKDGCMIYCSKGREEEVLEKFNINNDDPIKRFNPIQKKKKNGKK
jgi:hypothetical protein